MESNSGLDAAGARSALDAAHRAARDVRDVQWPTWLYVANAVLLVLMGASPLVADGQPLPWLLTALAIGAVNVAGGRSTGAPLAVPTSRAFRAGVVVAGGSVAAALIADLLGAGSGPVLALALVAGAAFGIGSAAHRRSTR